MTVYIFESNEELFVANYTNMTNYTNLKSANIFNV